MFGKALYYPTIDINNEEWLKTAYLFWDGISTIVPESMVDNAYQHATTQYLKEERYLQPIIVNPDCDVVRDMVDVVEKYALTDEGRESLHQEFRGDENYSFYNDERRAFYLHHEKLPKHVGRSLLGSRSCLDYPDTIDYDDKWIRVTGNFADFYMTLLANRIASQNSLALLSSPNYFEKVSDRFSVDEYQASNALPPDQRESIGRCLLTKMVIDGITIDPLTSFEDLREFKERHQEELCNFREGFYEMAKMEIPPDISFNGLEQRARDIYNNRLLHSYRELRHSLRRSRINFLMGGLGAIAFTNVSTCFSDIISHLQHPVQLTIGAGAMLAYEGFKTVRANQDLRSQNKMSYLLSIEEELGERRRRRFFDSASRRSE